MHTIFDAAAYHARYIIVNCMHRKLITNGSKWVKYTIESWIILRDKSAAVSRGVKHSSGSLNLRVVPL